MVLNTTGSAIRPRQITASAPRSCSLRPLHQAPAAPAISAQLSRGRVAAVQAAALGRSVGAGFCSARRDDGSSSGVFGAFLYRTSSSSTPTSTPGMSSAMGSCPAPRPPRRGALAGAAGPAAAAVGSSSSNTSSAAASSGGAAAAEAVKTVPLKYVVQAAVSATAGDAAERGRAGGCSVR
jgi:hypothetical protein